MGAAVFVNVGVIVVTKMVGLSVLTMIVGLVDGSTDAKITVGKRDIVVVGFCVST